MYPGNFSFLIRHTGIELLTSNSKDLSDDNLLGTKHEHAYQKEEKETSTKEFSLKNLEERIKF